jgi:hypothetical protein
VLSVFVWSQYFFNLCILFSYTLYSFGFADLGLAARIQFQVVQMWPYKQTYRQSNAQRISQQPVCWYRSRLAFYRYLVLIVTRLMAVWRIFFVFFFSVFPNIYQNRQINVTIIPNYTTESD